MIKNSRFLPINERNIVDNVIQRNSFFAHQENLLIAMMCDDRDCIRELAARRILQARARNSEEQTIQLFESPKINFEAEDYIDMIAWNEVKMLEPPLTQSVESADLLECIKIKNIPKIQFIKYPNHTQAVERNIKIVTEASSSVCGAVNRDGYIRNVIKSRQLMKSFDTKSDYKF